ncbi:hypothetical protein MWN34_00755 [Ancylobacter sp. 6x-1]|uniref:Uncharacterized protein n=1 Tax=Ancylobacter crimeensis TaxID=2579147 RepID=A0ABT0D662_9HYPH|nr:hypothetical protein [Ancylobacter crimeensis]MCK0195435.1 hypothetical protein [Ancylobacter crimeensis]
MLKTVFISAIASIACAFALFAGAASATGYLNRGTEVVDVAAPLAQDIAGDCVVQTRWVQSGGKMIQVERPVCY